MFRYLLLLTALVCAQAKHDFTGHRLISIQAKNGAELEFLRSLEDNADFLLDFWTEPSLVRATDIRVPPTSYSKLRKSLQKAGIKFKVVKDNVQDFIDVEARSMASRAVGNFTNTYLNYKEVLAFAYAMEDLYPARVAVRVYGNSSEGIPLLEVKIAANLNSPKQAIWIEAGTHAREWITVSTALNLIYTLASGTEDGDAMLTKYDWYITPSHNPDGYEYTWTNDRMWRKNRQHTSGRCVGTDLNRNWNANYGGTGSSPNKCSETYRGTEVFSAPETNALAQAVAETPNVVAFFSVHCYSQLMLFPYGYKNEKPKDYDDLKDVANHMMAALAEVNGRHFVVGSSAEVLYRASGCSDDYFYDTGIKYSYTYELRPATSNEGGFILAASHIEPAARETIASLKAFTEMDLP